MNLSDNDVDMLLGTYSPSAQGGAASFNTKRVYAALVELRARRGGEWVCPGCGIRQESPNEPKADF